MESILKPEDYDPSNEDHARQGVEAAYRQRLRGVQDAFDDLDVEALEAEVVWGKDIADRLNPLRQQERTLMANVSRYLKSQQKRPRIRETSENMDKIERVIYQGLADPDAFGEKTKQVIVGIEDFLKKYLKR